MANNLPIQNQPITPNNPQNNFNSKSNFSSASILGLSLFIFLLIILGIGAYALIGGKSIGLLSKKQLSNRNTSESSMEGQQSVNLSLMTGQKVCSTKKLTTIPAEYKNVGAIVFSKDGSHVGYPVNNVNFTYQNTSSGFYVINGVKQKES
jgi:hypothetical protein